MIQIEELVENVDDMGFEAQELQQVSNDSTRYLLGEFTSSTTQSESLVGLLNRQAGVLSVSFGTLMEGERPHNDDGDDDDDGGRDGDGGDDVLVVQYDPDLSGARTMMIVSVWSE
eukprot:TRINITY_DN1696_c0_g2_i3.p1 TRINITY_DN1696_c0_g2~~TRINITY_DN1696_c0_g2_i3.p1  ORF type:complete len:115 (+),score=37.41 TRINITY_DN1696_c0_g2_i3:57-401(+)